MSDRGKFVNVTLLDDNLDLLQILAMAANPILPSPKPDHSFTRRPTSSNLAQFFWRKRMWFESTFVLSMLEPWEKILLRQSVSLSHIN